MSNQDIKYKISLSLIHKNTKVEVFSFNTDFEGQIDGITMANPKKASNEELFEAFKHGLSQIRRDIDCILDNSSLDKGQN